MNLKTIAKGTICMIALALAAEGISLVAPLTLNLTPAAEAQCRPTRRTAGGVRILNCTPGGKSCCRKTGRTKTVNGKRYEVLDCSRCR
jgi:hypothetical protein